MYTPEYAGHPFRSLNYAHPLARRLAISCSGYNHNRWTGVTIYKSEIWWNKARRKVAISSPISPYGLLPLLGQYSHRKGGAFIRDDGAQFLYIHRQGLGYSDLRYFYAVHQPPNFPPSSETVATDRIYIQYYLVFSGVNILAACGLSYPDNNLSLAADVYLGWESGIDVIRFYVGGDIVYSVSAPLIMRSTDKKVLVVTFLLDPIQQDNTKNYLMKVQIFPSSSLAGTPNPVFSYSNHWSTLPESYPPYFLIKGFATSINIYGQQNQGYPFYHGWLVLDHSKQFSSFSEVDLFPTAQIARDLIRTSGQDLWLKPSDLIPGIFTYEAGGLSVTASDSRIGVFDPYQSFGTVPTATEAQVVNRLTIRGAGTAPTYSLGQFYNLLLSTLIYTSSRTATDVNIEAIAIRLAWSLAQTSTESRIPVSALLKPSGLLTTETDVIADSSVWIKSALDCSTQSVILYNITGKIKDIYFAASTPTESNSLAKLYDQLGIEGQTDTESLSIIRVHLTPLLLAETPTDSDAVTKQFVLGYLIGATETELRGRIGPPGGALTSLGYAQTPTEISLEHSQFVRGFGTLWTETEGALGSGAYVVSSHLLAAHESVFLPYFPSLCIVSAFPVTLTLGEQQYRLTERLSGAAETATVSLPITEGISGIAVQAETGGILTESYVTVNLIQYPGLGWYKDQTVTQIII